MCNIYIYWYIIYNKPFILIWIRTYYVFSQSNNSNNILIVYPQPPRSKIFKAPRIASCRPDGRIPLAGQRPPESPRAAWKGSGCATGVNHKIWERSGISHAKKAGISPEDAGFNKSGVGISELMQASNMIKYDDFHLGTTEFRDQTWLFDHQAVDFDHQDMDFKN